MRSNWPLGAALAALIVVPQLVSGPPTPVDIADASGVGWPAQPDAAAQELCGQRLERHQAGGDPFNASLLAAYPASVSDVVVEHERLRPPGFRSGLRERDAQGFAAVCFFEADAFGLPAPPRPGRAIPDGVHTRVQEVVLPSTEVFGMRAGGAADVQPEWNPGGSR